MTVPEHLWSAGPADPRLEDDDVHVWCISLDDPRWAQPALRAEMTADETERADAFHFARHRRRFVVARGTLRRILSLYVGVEPRALTFAYGPRGKPDLETGAPAGRLRFNLSHSHGLALCALTLDREIGVDVEEMRDRVEIDKIAERFFSARENEEYRALHAGQRREAFFRCWTRKEAYLKAIGEGLFRCSQGFDVTVHPRQEARLLRIDGSAERAARWELRDLTPAPGFVGAVILDGPGRAPGRWRLDP